MPDPSDLPSLPKLPDLPAAPAAPTASDDESFEVVTPREDPDSITASIDQSDEEEMENASSDRPVFSMGPVAKFFLVSIVSSAIVLVIKFAFFNTEDNPLNRLVPETNSTPNYRYTPTPQGPTNSNPSSTSPNAPPGYRPALRSPQGVRMHDGKIPEGAIRFNNVKELNEYLKNKEKQNSIDMNEQP